MAGRAAVTVFLLAAFSGVLPVSPPTGAEVSRAPAVATALELLPIGRRQVVLNPDRLVMLRADRGDTQEVPVLLRETIYQAATLVVRGGEASKWSGRLVCYELDSEAPYTWAVWSTAVPLAGFRLFTAGAGDNHLAWVWGCSVQIAEVSKPRDRCVALAQHLLRTEETDITLVPVRDLVPASGGWGVNAFYRDINILDVARDEAGNWTVEISGPDSPEVYTLVSEGGQWHSQE